MRDVSHVYCISVNARRKILYKVWIWRTAQWLKKQFNAIVYSTLPGIAHCLAPGLELDLANPLNDIRERKGWRGCGGQEINLNAKRFRVYVYRNRDGFVRVVIQCGFIHTYRMSEYPFLLETFNLFLLILMPSLYNSMYSKCSSLLKPC